MPANVLGERFSITSFGESHGKCIGTIVDGCPAGLKLDEHRYTAITRFKKARTINNNNTEKRNR